MARRKTRRTKRRNGLGYNADTHASRAGVFADSANGTYKRAVKALNDGDCDKAAKALMDTHFDLGIAKAELNIATDQKRDLSETYATHHKYAERTYDEVRDKTVKVMKDFQQACRFVRPRK